MRVAPLLALRLLLCEGPSSMPVLTEIDWMQRKLTGERAFLATRKIQLFGGKFYWRCDACIEYIQIEKGHIDAKGHVVKTKSWLCDQRAALQQQEASRRIQAELQQEGVRSATLADENKRLKERLEELEAARPVEATHTVSASVEAVLEPVQQLDAGTLNSDFRLGNMNMDGLLGGDNFPEDVMTGRVPKRLETSCESPSPSTAMNWAHLPSFEQDTFFYPPVLPDKPVHVAAPAVPIAAAPKHVRSATLADIPKERGDVQRAVDKPAVEANNAREHSCLGSKRASIDAKHVRAVKAKVQKRMIVLVDLEADNADVASSVAAGPTQPAFDPPAWLLPGPRLLATKRS